MPVLRAANKSFQVRSEASGISRVRRADSPRFMSNQLATGPSEAAYGTIRGMPDFGDDLWPAERRLLEAVRSGQRCDLADGEPVSAEQMSTWGSDRTVRGPRLHRLLTDHATAGLD